MGFVDAIRNGFSNYATFSGRASRPAYWWWMLFVILASAVLSGIDLALFGADPETGAAVFLRHCYSQIAGLRDRLVELVWEFTCPVSFQPERIVETCA